MNILFIANHCNAGGISSYILSLSKGLTARGHKVYVASRGGEWLERLARDNIEHIYVPLATKSIVSPKLIFTYFILKKVITQRHIELIHSQTRVGNVVAHWLSKSTSVPYITTAHGFFRPHWGRMLFPCWGKRVIAISDAVRTHLIEDFQVDREKIRLVHNGIDISHQVTFQLCSGHDKGSPRVHQEEIRKKFGLKDGPVVGIIARLSGVKGHKYLIKAMKKVIEVIPNAQLLSVGDGKIKNSLEDLAKKLGLSEHIHFIPVVLDTAECLSVMDVFVMPSLQEGLGLAIMEAMREGIPVVGSSVGGIASLIKDGQTGILVSPADSEGLARAIIDVLKDNQKAQRLSRNAQDMVRKDFSLEKMAEDTERIYQECLSQKR